MERDFIIRDFLFGIRKSDLIARNGVEGRGPGPDEADLLEEGVLRRGAPHREPRRLVRQQRRPRAGARNSGGAGGLLNWITRKHSH